jgi:hypothetical protein
VRRAREIEILTEFGLVSRPADFGLGFLLHIEGEFFVDCSSVGQQPRGSGLGINQLVMAASHWLLGLTRQEVGQGKALLLHGFHVSLTPSASRKIVEVEEQAHGAFALNPRLVLPVVARVYGGLSLEAAKMGATLHGAPVRGSGRSALRLRARCRVEKRH